jgi:hypothetical protein
MEQKKYEAIFQNKVRNIRFHRKAMLPILGSVIFGCIRKGIWWSAFSIKSKLSGVLLLVMIS